MSFSQVLILDDDIPFRARVREALTGGYELIEAANEGEFRAKYRPYQFDLLLLDMRLRQDREGLDVLREVYVQDELQPVIMMSSYGDTESAIEAVGAGAMMFLHKQEFSPALLGRMVEAVIEQGRLRRQVRALRQMAWADVPDTLLGNSPAIREAVASLREMANNPERVPIIVGERGTGTSLAARMIHRQGPQLDGSFLETDAGRVTQPEVFFNDRLSPWIQAASGTLAMDGTERIERRFGRALMERLLVDSEGQQTPRVVFLQHEGASPTRKGFLALPSWLNAGAPTVSVRLPPLRERREDVPLLAAHFLQTQRASGRTPARSINAKALERLEAHDWPGNVRELRNAVEYAAMQTAATAAEEVGLEHLPAGLGAMPMGSETKSSSSSVNGNYRLHLARAELELADRAIRERGITQKSALLAALGYSDRFTLGRRINKALTDFPALGSDFSAVAKLFRGERKK